MSSNIVDSKSVDPTLGRTQEGQRSMSQPRQEHGISMGQGTEASMEQVRELLFGAHMRELQTRAEQLEAQTASALKQSRDQINKRLDALEHSLRREFQSIREEIAAEKDTRALVAEKIRAELKDTENSLSDYLDALRNECSASYEQLEADLQEQTFQLRQENQQAFDHLHDVFSQKCSSLQRSKVDSAVISSLFNELALRLMDPGNPKGTEKQ